MNVMPDSLQELINQFSRLPGIGRKTAERLSIYILKTNAQNVNEFADSLKFLKESIKVCDTCHCFMQHEKCIVCNNHNRLDSLICIVEDPVDVFLIDKSGFKGMYHVIGGLISPLDGVTHEHLNIKSLLDRISKVEEIIIALDPSSEGDMTCLHLCDLLKSYNIKLSRLARGVPVGSSLEFIDQVTLTHSINDRVEIK